MSELILGLFCLAVGLMIVAVVGHGLWVAMAAIGRWLSGAAPAAPRVRRLCINCGAAQGVIDGRCGYCGFQPDASPIARLSSELETAARVLARWECDGLLSGEQHATLQAIVVQERMKLSLSERSGAAQGRVVEAAPEPAAATFPAAAPPQVAATEPELASGAIAFLDTPLDAIVVSKPFASARSEATAPRQVHPLDRDYSAAPSPAAPTFSHRARRRLADVLGAFMEERNIRWGEVIAGLLIVGSAIGFLVSVQEELLRADPYVPAFLFLLATAAIYGAGTYTLRRWDLQSVSRAILVIALLLIPLNFLAATSSPEKRAVSDPIYWLAVTVGLSVFGAITWSAGRTLMRGGALRLTLAVLGAAAAQLWVSRLARPEMGVGAATLLIAAPAALIVGAMLGQTWRATRWKRLTQRRAEEAFLVTGIGAFSLAAVLGLLAYRMGSVPVAAERLSPVMSVVAASIVALGLAVAQRAAQSSGKGPKNATSRTTALTIALLGASLMTANLVFAWPEPMLTVVVGALSFVTLAALAAAFGQPALHGPAMVCLTLAYVVGFHLLQEGAYDRELGRRLLELFWMGRTSAALGALAVVSAGAGLGLIRTGRRSDGLPYLGAAGGLTLLSALLALGVGFLGGPDTDWATAILGAYTLALLAAAVARGAPVAAAAGSLLLLATLIHGLARNDLVRDALHEASILPQRPVLAATLAHGLICVGLAMAIFLRRRRDADFHWPSWNDLPNPFRGVDLRDPLREVSVRGRAFTISTFTLSAFVTSLAAVPFALYVAGSDAAPNAAYFGIIAAVWFAIAVLHRWPAMMSAGGWTATVAIIFAATAVAQRQAWWTDSLMHARYVQIVASTLAVWSLLWSVWRRLAEKNEIWGRLLNTPWAAADQVALGCAVAGVVAMAVAGCLPGVRAELGLALPTRPLLEAESLTGFHPMLVYDVGGWIAAGLVLLACCGALAERISLAGLLGLTISLAAVPLLTAAPFGASAATASALRWWFAVYGAVMAAAICARRSLRGAVESWTWVRRGAIPPPAVEALRSTAFLLALAPVLGLTVAACVRFLAGHQLGGPAAGSPFGALPASVLYAVPMLCLAAILTAYALREKSSGYLLAASVLFQTTATLACLLSVAPAGEAARTRVALLQWNAVALGGFSLLWLSLRSRVAETTDAGAAPRDLFPVQLVATLAAAAALGAWAALGVFFQPAQPPVDVIYLGRAASYLALVLAIGAGIWWTRGGKPRARFDLGLGGWVVLGALAAASLASWSSARAWTSYYVLTAAWLVAVVVATAGALAARRLVGKPTPNDASAAAEQTATRPAAIALQSAALWASWLGLAVVMLALGAAWNDPWRPWCSATPAAVLAICAGCLSLAQDNRGFAYAGTALLALAASLVAMGPFTGLWRRDEGLAILDLIEANLLAATAAGGVSLAYFLRREQRAAPPTVRFAPPVHAVAAIGATIIFALVAVIGMLFGALARDWGGRTDVFVGNALGILTAAILGGLLIASLWNRQARYSAPCLYLWGTICLILGIDQLRLKLPETVLAAAVAAASYVMVTGLLWRSGIGIAKSGARLGVPDPVEGLKRISTWLPGVNAFHAVLWTCLALGMVLGYEDRGMRYAAAMVPLLLAIGVGSLAQLERQRRMQLGSLLLATIAAVFLGWADIPPTGSASVWLHRCVRMLIVLAAIAAASGGVALRLLSFQHAWRESVRRMTVANGAAALIALSVVLLLEWSLFESGVGVPGLEGPQIFAVAVVLAGLAAALISLALFPNRDPLALPEAQRIRYVYAAEAIAALLFAHLYMTLPELFSGWLRDGWPYIVVILAYVGVGLGELFRRSEVRVLAEPLGRTGVFLPLLPALAFWAQASLTSYSGVLFWVGLLYVVLSIQHKSFVYGVAAGLAGNGALWALMQDRDFTIFEHPQFWLIPPALSVLVASHLTRDQLKESQLTGIRYLAMLVIYLSSTGEMFITGIGESLWPVMVLMALSVAGMLAGIGLRVRAFLYLGAGFLVLSLVSMVWNAAQAFNHVWPWWAFGFSLGVTILVLFALFEKRRDVFLRRVEQLGEWEP